MNIWRVRAKIIRGKIAHWLGRPHKHLFDRRFRGKVNENPCVICGQTFYQLGSGRKTVPKMPRECGGGWDLDTRERTGVTEWRCMDCGARSPLECHLLKVKLGDLSD